ncbi:hypothetical protein [Pseudoduganella albidiflava]|uniref:Uncharacterized protein n=1 Tax=Pseudoduganella albidiflava TaxID=321983 RepID=A0A411X5G8_9BURK|nr:hypothetical protein [Pseudoduganella albidiflava]QBI04133.1 hypothetical protein EYF70_27430 [Pseudoduganella albidiflava]GGY24946.1 hypothetical protein GCM10007387_03160 [Pseudoduganella albidiflava]
MDQEIVMILRDVARRLAWESSDVSAKWEMDDYAAGFVTAKLRALHQQDNSGAALIAEAERIVWRTVENGQAFNEPTSSLIPTSEPWKSLRLELAHYFDMPLLALPTELQERVKSSFYPFQWDELAPENREKLAFQSDSKNDPAKESERQYWRELGCKIDEIEQEIAKWTAMDHKGVPSEAALQDERLLLLRAQLDELKKSWLRPFIKTTTEDSPLPEASAKMSPVERRKALDISRERGCRRRIIESWNNIEMTHGPRPGARQVLRYLKLDKDDVEPQLKTVQNHLIELRKEGLIP